MAISLINSKPHAESPKATTSDESQATSPGPGAMLREARLAQHRSLQEVARVLTLSVANLEALENDRYDLLPNNAQINHYLVNYAQLLRLPEQHIRNAVEAHLAHAEFYATRSLRVARPFLLNLLMLSLPAVVLVLSVAWWYVHENNWHDVFMQRLGEDDVHLLSTSPVHEASHASDTAASNVTSIPPGTASAY